VNYCWEIIYLHTSHGSRATIYRWGG